jgi:two-component system, cell cycle sensor histidine kinase and response regulator CckA
MGFDDTAAKTILVVDDDRAVLTLVGAFLERGGYTVLTASDGAEAVSIFQQHQERIALLLTDVTMPRMDGLRLADAVLTLRPQLPVIFMSGNMQHANRGYGCIAKPFTSGEIVGSVRQALAAIEQRVPRHTAQLKAAGEGLTSATPKV